jgi:hypothetical protein
MSSDKSRDNNLPCRFNINWSIRALLTYHNISQIKLDDIDRKLDHLGWKSLQEWLLSRLKALNDQLNEQNQGHVRRLKALNDKFIEQNQVLFRKPLL